MRHLLDLVLGLVAAHNIVEQNLLRLLLAAKADHGVNLSSTQKHTQNKTIQQKQRSSRTENKTKQGAQHETTIRTVNKLLCKLKKTTNMKYIRIYILVYTIKIKINEKDCLRDNLVFGGATGRKTNQLIEGRPVGFHKATMGCPLRGNTRDKTTTSQHRWKQVRTNALRIGTRV